MGLTPGVRIRLVNSQMAARLYHVIDEWNLYSQNPTLILVGTGLGTFGALIGGAIGLVI